MTRILPMIVMLTAASAALADLPDHALWGAIPHAVDGKGRFRAQARDATGEFIAANTEPGTLQRGAFHVGGGTWDSNTGQVRAIVLDAAGTRSTATQRGADALPQKHLFLYVGCGATKNKPNPVGMFEGQLAEVLVFNRALGDAEQQQVETYLADRHLRKGGGELPRVDGLVLHLDAAHVEQMAGHVARWPDRSGRGNDAHAEDEGPVVVEAATPGGAPAVRFNGKGHFVVRSNPADFDGLARTWYVVFSADKLNNARILNGAYGNISPRSAAADNAPKLKRMRFNNPGLVVDLGVGLWGNPLPMDADGDGELELYVASMGKPDRGIYAFKPLDDGPGPMRFAPGEKVSTAMHNLRTARTHDGKWVVVSPGRIYTDFANHGLSKYVQIDYEKPFYSGRANQWSIFDYDGDGVDDLVIGVDDWREYGWDDAYDKDGHWTNGPLRGHVWWVRNTGTNERPKYGEAQQLTVEGQPLEVYGYPSPCFADFNGDGLPDLICGEFLDRMTFFENVGTREKPRYAPGRFIEHDGQTIRMDLQMIIPTAVDWDGDGHADLLVGEEDGTVSLIRNTGSVQDGMPRFEAPRKLQQAADELKVNLLATPATVDWDGDGDEDLIVGDSAGYVNFVENLGGNPIKWAAPVKLEAGGETLRILAGDNGSIQGPAEAKWGYTSVEVADWDHDGLPDVLVNNIWGRILWYRNVGTRTAPKLAAAQPVKVKWDGQPRYPAWNWWKPKPDEFVTQWRSSVRALDLTGDGLLDLVALDEDGYLALFERREIDGELFITPGKRVFHVEPGKDNVVDTNQKSLTFDENKDGVNDLASLNDKGQLTFHYRQVNYDGKTVDAPIRFADRGDDPRYRDPSNATALRMTSGWAGRSGRRKFTLVDWDRDGKLDLLVNSVNMNFLRNVADQPGAFVFRDMGPVDPLALAGHTTSPAAMDLDGDGKPDLIIGAEDGFLYELVNPN